MRIEKSRFWALVHQFWYATLAYQHNFSNSTPFFIRLWPRDKSIYERWLADSIVSQENARLEKKKAGKIRDETMMMIYSCLNINILGWAVTNLSSCTMVKPLNHEPWLVVNLFKIPQIYQNQQILYIVYIHCKEERMMSSK